MALDVDIRGMPTPVFYNSYTKQVEEFVPSEAGKVKLYHCGPTVYKRQHLGNMRRVLFADFLRRSLEFLGYEVREITNITDVGHLTQDEIDAGEDKMAKAAQEGKTTPADIAEREIAHFHADLAALNVQPSHKYPRATEHIKQMQEIIAELLKTDHAYQTDTGIYYDVSTFPNYGKLSGNTLSALAAGKRIEVRDDKRNPADFALWIFDEDALQEWESPWGTGYPGWHIECSAMSAAYLDLPIDIHTGGEDNKFPHHENEIAQTEGITEGAFVNYWMHNAHLNLAGGKLAKSSGEQLTLDEVTERGISPLAFRLLVFGTQYRTKQEFSWEALDAADENLNTIRQLLRRLLEVAPADTLVEPDGAVLKSFAEALADDLSTPNALAVVNGLITTLNKGLDDGLDPAVAQKAWSTLLKLDHVLGIISPLLTELSADSAPAKLQKLAEQREQARMDKDFSRADELRQQIEEAGFEVEDTPDGPRLLKKTSG